MKHTPRLCGGGGGGGGAVIGHLALQTYGLKTIRKDLISDFYEQTSGFIYKRHS